MPHFTKENLYEIHSFMDKEIQNLALSYSDKNNLEGLKALPQILLVLGLQLSLKLGTPEELSEELGELITEVELGNFCCNDNKEDINSN